MLIAGRTSPLWAQWFMLDRTLEWESPSPGLSKRTSEFSEKWIDELTSYGANEAERPGGLASKRLDVWPKVSAHLVRV